MGDWTRAGGEGGAGKTGATSGAYVFAVISEEDAQDAAHREGADAGREKRGDGRKKRRVVACPPTNTRNDLVSRFSHHASEIHHSANH
jgi:hypothetical protein